MTGTKPLTVNLHPTAATNTKMFLAAQPSGERTNLKGLSACRVRACVFMHGLLHVHKHTLGEERSFLELHK